MLNKSRGHILRIATVLHLLFHLDDPHHQLDVVVSEEAIRAAVNFIQVASQHTAFIAGRGLLSEELEKFKAGTYMRSCWCNRLLTVQLNNYNLYTVKPL